MPRSALVYRFLAAAIGATASVLLTIGATFALGMPAYFVGVFVLVPAIMLVAAGRPWRLPEVLASAAGTLVGPGLAGAGMTAVDVVRGDATLGHVLDVAVVTALYFTGFGTLIGILVATAVGTSRRPATPDGATKP